METCRRLRPQSCVFACGGCRSSVTTSPGHRTALRLVVALVLLGLISHGTFVGTGDEPHYLAITHSLAFDLDFDLSNNYGANEPLIAAGNLAPENHVRAGTGGVVRPIHDVGMPMLAAPLIRVLRPAADWISRTLPEPAMQRMKLTPTVLYRHGISMLMIAVAVGLSGLLFDTFVRLGASPRAAVGAVLIVSLSPPLLIHSVVYFTELLTAFSCLWVFTRLSFPWLPLNSTPHAAFRLKAEATKVIGATGGIWGWGMTGAVVGLLMLIHARNAGLVLAFTILGGRAAWRTGRRAAAAFALGLAALLAVRTVITYHFWGTLVTTPHAAIGELAPAGMGREAATRLAGMLVDQEFGLLLYAPVYLLALFGLAVIPDRTTARRVMFVSACYLILIVLPVTNVQGWTGGWSPAARFLTPIAPLLALPLPWTFGHTPRLVLALALALQLAIDGYMWQNPKDLWNDGDGTAAVCERSRLAICRYLPSFVGE